MDSFNTALTTHFKRYLNTLSVPLADQTLFGETDVSSYSRFKPAADTLIHALSMPKRSHDTLWRNALSHLQQAQPMLSPWHGALRWQTALGRLQQGLAGEESLLPENLLEEHVADDLLALPDMPEPDGDLFALDGGSAELDALFADTPPAVAPSVAKPTITAAVAAPQEPASHAVEVEPDIEAMFADASTTEFDLEEDISAAVGDFNSETVTRAETEAVIVSQPTPPATPASFSEMPWNAAASPVTNNPASRPAQVEDFAPIHVPAGRTTSQAENLAKHAPPAAHNPILTATQQALQSAQAAAAQPVATAAPLDPKTHSSKAFFSSLPWGGSQAS